MEYRGRGRGRPPGLRGREIGMYYRDMAQKRKKERGEGHITLGASVSVPPGVLDRVQECLHNFTQRKEEERVSHEFAERFRDLLKVNFEEFIDQSMKRKSEARVGHGDTLNANLKSELVSKESSEEFRRIYNQRQKLPAMQQKDKILAAIQENQVLLIVGSTGCGKTTQVPQLLLDHYIHAERGGQCQIVCTQPRRISAVSVAERVAYERFESLGNTVGYQIRLESRMPREYCSILYCTTGILLQKMQSDPLMQGLTAVILDEIHERSVETDLLMALLKKILPHRPDLKVILMSATITEHVFSEYFNNCSIIRIDGTLFPVEVVYLEDILKETGFTKFQDEPFTQIKHGRQRKKDRLNNEKRMQYSLMIEPYLRHLRDKYDTGVLQALRCSDSEGCSNLLFLEHLVFYICEHKPPGAILVFLPGYESISKLNAQLQKPSTPRHQRLAAKLHVYPLHSMMPTVNQRSVFQPPPPGMRKVILSTIIAETSVTIDDVVYVINTGRTRISTYNVEANMQTLEEDWVTRANSQQRKGRAGRVQPGICYNLFTKAREELMADVPVPEILRSRLENIILNLKLLHIADPFEFLKILIDAPEASAIQNGLKLLKRIGALDENSTITPLGMHLAHLPIDPQMGKMILMGALFRCVDPITSVASGLSFKSPFYIPLGLEQKVDRVKQNIAGNTKSDHLLIHNAIIRYREAREDRRELDFCYENFISHFTMQQLENMKKQFAELLKCASFTESPGCCAKSSNTNSENITLLRAIIASGLYPNMAHLRKARQVGRRVHAIHSMSTPEERRINFHPSSVNSGQMSFDSNYFVYFKKQKTSELYILDATMVFPMALLIFGDGVFAGVTPDGQCYICVAHTYYFKCDEQTSSIILSLREKLEWLLQKKALHPSPIAPNSSDEYLIKAIQILLSLDDVGDDIEYFSTDDEDIQ